MNNSSDWTDICSAVAQGNEKLHQNSVAFAFLVRYLIRYLSTQTPADLNEASQMVEMFRSAIASPACTVDKADAVRLFSYAIRSLAEFPPKVIGKRWIAEAGVKRKILELLWKTKRLGVAEIRQSLGLQASHVSNELKDLDKAGFIVRDRVGTSIFVTLSPSGHNLVRELFADDEQKVSARLPTKTTFWHRHHPGFLNVVKPPDHQAVDFGLGTYCEDEFVHTAFVAAEVFKSRAPLRPQFLHTEKPEMDAHQELLEAAIARQINNRVSA